MKHLIGLFVIPIILSCAFAQIDTLFTPLWIPVRTGDSLAADLYSLDTTVPKPVILIQTPYNKISYRIASFSWVPEDTSGLWNLVDYNYVFVDWRGFYASSDADSAGYDRGLDGYDCVEWIAPQSWSDGNIGTYGGSALGAIQFLTARHQPPHLICAAPWIIDYQQQYVDYYYGGVWRREHSDALSFLGFGRPAFVLEHPLYDGLWLYVETMSDYSEEFEIPMLLVSGWFDHYPGCIIRAFHDIRARSHISVRDKHKLLIGPWTHSGIGKLVQGELEYPAAEDYDESMVKAFFNFYLRGAPNGYEDEPVGQYFIMGGDEWFCTDDWYSISDSIYTLYLHPAELLSGSEPPSSASPDSFLYDPRDPSPIFGGARFNPSDPGAIAGPRDVRDSVESRDDNLIYSTSPLTENLTILGNIIVRLFISSNRLDTDFAVRICDVYPDGRSMILTQGIRRARLRNSFSEEELMIPGDIYLVEVVMDPIAQTFLPGHSFRIIITSAIFPHFDTNINDGGPMYEQGDTLIATNFIYHDTAHSSSLLLPIVSSIGIGENGNCRPKSFTIDAYPNPFNSSVKIRVRGIEVSRGRVEIFDINGRMVAEMSVGESESAKPLSTNASGACRWQPNDNIGSGVYLVRAIIGDEKSTKRVVYLK